MTGKLMFVPDVDTLSNIIRSIDGNHSLGVGALAKAVIAAIDTPPVLRWDGDYLKVGNIPIAIADEFRGDFAWSCQREEGSAKSLEEARRAAEKALGLPIVEEV